MTLDRAATAEDARLRASARRLAEVQRLALEPTEIGPVVATAAGSVKLCAKEEGLDLQVWTSPDIGRVMGDAAQLERLVLNLLTNAIKFTKDGRIRVCVKREDDEIVLVVADTGVGIPAEELQRMFRPFFRSSSSEQAVAGTGLGMVIVKAIVDQHHGTVDLSSEPGRGTTVTVRLPVLKEEAGLAEPGFYQLAQVPGRR